MNLLKFQRLLVLSLFLLLGGLFISGCSLNNERQLPSSGNGTISHENYCHRKGSNLQFAENDPWHELELRSKRWFFGKGVGTTAVNIGTTAVFPPYGLFLLLNTGVELAGYERLDAVELLPHPAQSEVDLIYKGVTGAPGYLHSWIFGQRYCH